MPVAYDTFMNETIGSEVELDGSAWQAAERARTLRMQADWCVDMAAKVADPRLFRAYVEAATACQRQALSIEVGSAVGRGPGMGVSTYPG